MVLWWFILWHSQNLNQPWRGSFYIPFLAQWGWFMAVGESIRSFHGCLTALAPRCLKQEKEKTQEKRQYLDQKIVLQKCDEKENVWDWFYDLSKVSIWNEMSNLSVRRILFSFRPIPSSRCWNDPITDRSSFWINGGSQEFSLHIDTFSLPESMGLSEDRVSQNPIIEHWHNCSILVPIQTALNWYVPPPWKIGTIAYCWW